MWQPGCIWRPLGCLKTNDQFSLNHNIVHCVCVCLCVPSDIHQQKKKGAFPQFEILYKIAVHCGLLYSIYGHRSVMFPATGTKYSGNRVSGLGDCECRFGIAWLVWECVGGMMGAMGRV